MSDDAPAGRRIRVHHADGSDVSDHVIGLCTLLGYDFVRASPTSTIQPRASW